MHLVFVICVLLWCHITLIFKQKFTQTLHFMVTFIDLIVITTITTSKLILDVCEHTLVQSSFLAISSKHLHL